MVYDFTGKAALVILLYIILIISAKSIKLAMVSYEIKSLVEKIGTNRRLLNRIVLLDFKKPFDLIPYYKRSYEKENLSENNLKNSPSSFKKRQSNIWSGRQDLNL